MRLGSLQDLGLHFDNEEGRQRSAMASYSLAIMHDAALSCTRLRSLALCGHAYDRRTAEARTADTAKLAVLTSLAVHNDDAWLAGLPTALPSLTALRVLSLARPSRVFAHAGIAANQRMPALTNQLSGLTNLHTLQVSTCDATTKLQHCM